MAGKPMVAGIERLRRARELLSQTGRSAVDVTEAVVEAAEECWSASIDGDGWPVELRMRSAVIERMIFRQGSIRATISQMTHDELAKLQRDLFDFIAAAERFAEVS